LIPAARFGKLPSVGRTKRGRQQAAPAVGAAHKLARQC